MATALERARLSVSQPQQVRVGTGAKAFAPVGPTEGESALAGAEAGNLSASLYRAGESLYAELGFTPDPEFQRRIGTFIKDTPELHWLLRLADRDETVMESLSKIRSEKELRFYAEQHLATIERLQTMIANPVSGISGMIAGAVFDIPSLIPVVGTAGNLARVGAMAARGMRHARMVSALRVGGFAAAEAGLQGAAESVTDLSVDGGDILAWFGIGGITGGLLGGAFPRIGTSSAELRAAKAAAQRSPGARADIAEDVGIATGQAPKATPDTGAAEVPPVRQADPEQVQVTPTKTSAGSQGSDLDLTPDPAQPSGRLVLSPAEAKPAAKPAKGLAAARSAKDARAEAMAKSAASRKERAAIALQTAEAKKIDDAFRANRSNRSKQVPSEARREMNRQRTLMEALFPGQEVVSRDNIMEALRRSGVDITKQIEDSFRKTPQGFNFRKTNIHGREGPSQLLGLMEDELGFEFAKGPFFGPPGGVRAAKEILTDEPGRLFRNGERVDVTPDDLEIQLPSGEGRFYKEPTPEAVAKRQAEEAALEEAITGEPASPKKFDDPADVQTSVESLLSARGIKDLIPKDLQLLGSAPTQMAADAVAKTQGKDKSVIRAANDIARVVRVSTKSANEMAGKAVRHEMSVQEHLGVYKTERAGNTLGFLKGTTMPKVRASLRELGYGGTTWRRERYADVEPSVVSGWLPREFMTEEEIYRAVDGFRDRMALGADYQGYMRQAMPGVPDDAIEAVRPHILEAAEHINKHTDEIADELERHGLIAPKGEDVPGRPARVENYRADVYNPEASDDDLRAYYRAVIYGHDPSAEDVKDILGVDLPWEDLTDAQKALVRDIRNSVIDGGREELVELKAKKFAADKEMAQQELADLNADGINLIIARRTQKWNALKDQEEALTASYANAKSEAKLKQINKTLTRVELEIKDLEDEIDELGKIDLEFQDVNTRLFEEGRRLPKETASAMAAEVKVMNRHRTNLQKVFKEEDKRLQAQLKDIKEGKAFEDIEGPSRADERALQSRRAEIREKTERLAKLGKRLKNRHPNADRDGALAELREFAEEIKAEYPSLAGKQDMRTYEAALDAIERMMYRTRVEDVRMAGFRKNKDIDKLSTKADPINLERTVMRVRQAEDDFVNGVKGRETYNNEVPGEVHRINDYSVPGRLQDRVLDNRHLKSENNPLLQRVLIQDPRVLEQSQVMGPQVLLAWKKAFKFTASDPVRLKKEILARIERTTNDLPDTHKGLGKYLLHQFELETGAIGARQNQKLAEAGDFATAWNFITMLGQVIFMMPGDQASMHFARGLPELNLALGNLLGTAKYITKGKREDMLQNIADSGEFTQIALVAKAERLGSDFTRRGISDISRSQVVTRSMGKDGGPTSRALLHARAVRDASSNLFAKVTLLDGWTKGAEMHMGVVLQTDLLDILKTPYATWSKKYPEFAGALRTVGVGPSEATKIHKLIQEHGVIEIEAGVYLPKIEAWPEDIKDLWVRMVRERQAEAVAEASPGSTPPWMDTPTGRLFLQFTGHPQRIGQVFVTPARQQGIKSALSQQAVLIGLFGSAIGLAAKAHIQGRGEEYRERWASNEGRTQLVYDMITRSVMSTALYSTFSDLALIVGGNAIDQITGWNIGPSRLKHRSPLEALLGPTWTSGNRALSTLSDGLSALSGDEKAYDRLFKDNGAQLRRVTPFGHLFWFSALETALSGKE